MSAITQESFPSDELSGPRGLPEQQPETRPSNISQEEADYLLAIGPYRARLTAQKKLLAYAVSIRTQEGASGPNLPEYVVEELRDSVNRKKAELATFHSRYVMQPKSSRYHLSVVETETVDVFESHDEQEPADLVEVEKLNDWGRADADPVKQYLKEAARTPLLKAHEEVEIAKTIEAGVLAVGVSDGTVTYTGDATVEELAAVVHEGAVAKEHLISANLRLVVSVAVRYRGRGLDLLDLIQEGNAGLIRAVEKFDYTKGYKFSTYATWWIRQSITRGIGNTGDTVRIPIHMNEELTSMYRVEQKILRESGQAPTTAELAAELSTTPHKIEEMKQMRKRVISLEAPIGDGSTFGDLIESRDDEDIADIVHESTVYDAIQSVLGTLTEREGYVIASRMGLLDGEKKTLEDIGEVIGVSKERVRQIEAKTLSKLRHPSRAHLLSSLRA